MDYNEFEDLDESPDVVKVLDENGHEIEFTILDGLEKDEKRYLLVIETEFADEDEIEATILKEDYTDDDELVYIIVEDDNEFDEIVAMFKNSNKDYDIEI